MNIKEFFNQHKKQILYWFIFGAVVLVAAVAIWYYLPKESLREPIGNYYQSLAGECEKNQNKSCCVASVKKMRSNGYEQIPVDGCPKGLQKNQLRCIGSYSWCEPVVISQKPPKLPVIHLRYGEKVYKGLEGSYCWPTTEESSGREVETLCVDRVFQDPSDIISVAAGDTLAVEIEAHEPPKGLIARIFTANEPPIQSVRLDANFVAPFTVNLPVGVYIIQIAGDWPEGDAIYTFKIAVSNTCGPEPPAVCAAGMSLTCLNGEWSCREIEEKIVFGSQEECEQKTGQSCHFQNCDFIPSGKTFEETCGKDFKKGWVPKNPVSDTCGPEPPATCSANTRLACLDDKWECKRIEQKTEEKVDTSSWKTYSNQKIKFKYPKEWTFDSENIFKDSNGNTIMSLSSASTDVLGISFCEANSDNSRCESIKAIVNVPIIIDWQSDNQAVGETYTTQGEKVFITLQIINNKTKQIFRTIMSTVNIP